MLLLSLNTPECKREIPHGASIKPGILFKRSCPLLPVVGDINFVDGWNGRPWGALRCRPWGTAFKSRVRFAQWPCAGVRLEGSQLAP